MIGEILAVIYCDDHTVARSAYTCYLIQASILSYNISHSLKLLRVRNFVGTYNLSMRLCSNDEDTHRCCYLLIMITT